MPVLTLLMLPLTSPPSILVLADRWMDSSSGRISPSLPTEAAVSRNFLLFMLLLKDSVSLSNVVRRLEKDVEGELNEVKVWYGWYGMVQ